MAWNGSGAFTRTDGVFSGATLWAQEAAVPTNILATHFDTHDYDLAQGINACLAKNGENSMTGDLNMGGKNVTNALALRATSQVDVSLASTTHGLQVGASGSTNLSFGDMQVQARNNGAASTLALNNVGGMTTAGDFTVGIKLQTQGQLVASDYNVGSVPAPPTIFGSPPTLVVSGGVSAQTIDYWGGAIATGGALAFRKSRGANGTQTIVASGDALGSVNFYGSNGTSFDPAAQIIGEVDGTPGVAADMPGRLRFLTSLDGTATLVERFRIDNAGNVGVMGTTSPGLGGSQTPFLSFRQANNVRVGYVGYGSGANLYLYNENNGGPVTVLANDGGAVQRTLLNADPAGVLEAYYNGTGKLRTALETANAKGSGAEVRDGFGTYQPVGLGVFVATVTNSNFTIALSGLGAILQHTSGSHTYTTPNNADATCPAGFIIGVLNSAGVLSIAPGASVALTWFDGSGSLKSGTRSIAIGGVATLLKSDASNWYIYGTGIS